MVENNLLVLLFLRSRPFDKLCFSTFAKSARFSRTMCVCSLYPRVLAIPGGAMIGRRSSTPRIWRLGVGGESSRKCVFLERQRSIPHVSAFELVKSRNWGGSIVGACPPSTPTFPRLGSARSHSTSTFLRYIETNVFYRKQKRLVSFCFTSVCKSPAQTQVHHYSNRTALQCA